MLCYISAAKIFQCSKSHSKFSARKHPLQASMSTFETNFKSYTELFLLHLSAKIQTSEEMRLFFEGSHVGIILHTHSMDRIETEAPGESPHPAAWEKNPGIGGKGHSLTKSFSAVALRSDPGAGHVTRTCSFTRGRARRLIFPGTRSFPSPRLWRPEASGASASEIRALGPWGPGICMGSPELSNEPASS